MRRELGEDPETVLPTTAQRSDLEPLTGPEFGAATLGTSDDVVVRVGNH